MERCATLGAPLAGLPFSLPRAPSRWRWPAGSAVDREAAESLTARARGGDAAAFAELFAEYEADVQRLCRRMLPDDVGPGPEDAAGEVFLRARRAIASYDPERPFRPWLLAVAGHHCIDVLRRRSREKRLFDAEAPDGEDLASPGPSPLSNLVWSERRDALVAAVESLPARYRTPLMLRYFSDLDYAEIADTLGVSRGQVASLLFRAKRALRERLASEDVS